MKNLATAHIILTFLLALVKVCSAQDDAAAAADASSSSTACPTGFRYVAARRQCLPIKVRLLPLRSLSTADVPPSGTSYLQDKRPDTYVTASSTTSTILRADLGKKYTVLKVLMDYQNLSKRPVVVSVLDSTGATVGTGTMAPTGRQATVTMNLLKVVGTGTYGKKVPVDKSFRIKIPKVVAAASGAVRVSDVSFYGGSNPSDVRPGMQINWGLAVVVDFTNAKLEDYTQDSLAINNVIDLRTILNQMESHWRFVSHDKHMVEWSIQRITLDAAFGPNAFNNDWVQFRDALATQLLTKVKIADYDTNADGFLDHAWFILSSKDIEPGGTPQYRFCLTGESSHNGVSMFLDGQGDYAVKVNCIGCFNHEVAHTAAINLGDLYGDYDNLGLTSIMSYPWGENPGGFLAAELLKLGWIDVLRINDAAHVCLSPMEVKSSPFPYRAALIETGEPDEFFMVEYRKRPESGWGSGWWFDADGIIITHILTTGSNNDGPKPYISIEPADGSLQYGEWPNEEDLWDEHSADAFRGVLYDGTPIFTISNFVRPPNGTMCFDFAYLL